MPASVPVIIFLFLMTSSVAAPSPALYHIFRPLDPLPCDEEYGADDSPSAPERFCGRPFVMTMVRGCASRSRRLIILRKTLPDLVYPLVRSCARTRVDWSRIRRTLPALVRLRRSFPARRSFAHIQWMVPRALSKTSYASGSSRYGSTAYALTGRTGCGAGIGPAGLASGTAPGRFCGTGGAGRGKGVGAGAGGVGAFGGTAPSGGSVRTIIGAGGAGVVTAGGGGTGWRTVSIFPAFSP